MKKYLALLPALQIMLLTVSCNEGVSVNQKPGTAKDGDNTTDEQKLSAAKHLDSNYVAAFNKGSFNAIMETYWNSPDLVTYSLIVSGKDSIDFKASRISWYKTFDIVKGAAIQFTGIKNRIEGELVLGSGNWELKDSTGEIKGRGFYTNIKANRGGKWVYIMDNFTDRRLELWDRVN